MSATARVLRQQIADGKRRRVREHPAQVRAEAARHAAGRQAEGVSLWATARDLGVGMQTLQRWMAASAPRLRRIRVVEPARSPAVGRAVVVLPGGARIEGLSMDELTALVRVLS